MPPKLAKLGFPDSRPHPPALEIRMSMLNVKRFSKHVSSVDTDCLVPYMWKIRPMPHRYSDTLGMDGQADKQKHISTYTHTCVLQAYRELSGLAIQIDPDAAVCFRCRFDFYSLAQGRRVCTASATRASITSCKFTRGCARISKRAP